METPAAISTQHRTEEKRAALSRAALLLTIFGVFSGYLDNHHVLRGGSARQVEKRLTLIQNLQILKISVPILDINHGLLPVRHGGNYSKNIALLV